MPSIVPFGRTKFYRKSKGIECAKCERKIVNPKEKVIVNNNKVYHTECFEILYIETDYDPTDEEVKDFFKQEEPRGVKVIDKSIFCTQ